MDDNGDTCELLTTVVGVATTAEALRLMEGERFSLYVIDGQLPDACGFTFCEQVRRADKSAPIVIFTGKASEEDREAGVTAGANAYVVKPDVGELVSTVRRLLEEARPYLPHSSPR